MTDGFLLRLAKTPQTVFTLKAITQLFPDTSYQSLKQKIKYYVKFGKLTRLRTGIYTLGDFDPLELANKIYTPSYISLETVLQREGIVFQLYETIFVVSYLTREIEVGGQKIVYRKIKDEILLNQAGTEQKENYALASKERAFLDAVYLYKNYLFDNLSPLSGERVEELKGIYKSKALDKRVGEYYKDFQGRK